MHGGQLPRRKRANQKMVWCGCCAFPCSRFCWRCLYACWWMAHFLAPEVATYYHAALWNWIPQAIIRNNLLDVVSVWLRDQKRYSVHNSVSILPAASELIAKIARDKTEIQAVLNGRHRCFFNSTFVIICLIFIANTSLRERREVHIGQSWHTICHIFKSWRYMTQGAQFTRAHKAFSDDEENWCMEWFFHSQSKFLGLRDLLVQEGKVWVGLIFFVENLLVHALAPRKPNVMS